MSENSQSSSDSTTRATDLLMTPFVALPNLGFSALEASVGGAARAADVAAKAAENIGLVPGAGVAHDFFNRVADRSFGAMKRSRDTAFEGLRRFLGEETDKDTQELLSETYLKRAAEATTLPFFAAWDGTLAALDVDAVRQAAVEAGLYVSRLLDATGKKGVLEGKLAETTNANVRWGFSYMASDGPVGAVFDDLEGMVGGVSALVFGDTRWLGEGMKGYYGNMDYVYVKKEHGNVQPESDFPIGATLASYGSSVVEHYPKEFEKELDTGDLVESGKVYADEPGDVNTVLSAFPITTFFVLYDVAVFVLAAIFDSPDSQKYALCELAVMESNLSDAEKNEALGKGEGNLRDKAPKTTVEFEYYVPLLPPKKGTGDDYKIAYRSDASGKKRIVDESKDPPSVFNASALERAQSINSELFSLRSFLWLYRDEAIARQKNDAETTRKFGKHVTERIQKDPIYPLTHQEITELTEGGRRPESEVRDVFDDLLRKRGVDELADKIKAARAKASGKK